MRSAGVLIVLSAAGLVAAANAVACCRNYQEFADRCRSQGGEPSPATKTSPLKCSPKPSVPAPSQPARNDETNRQREADAENTAAAEAAAAAIEAQRKKDEAERQADFLRKRDAAAGTLRGSIGTSVGINSATGTQLRGSDVAVGTQLRGAASQPDLGGQHAAWKQLHCAASILSPALVALNLDNKANPDYAEFRFLTDEAANALNGQRLRVSCAAAPPMPRYTGPARDPARQAEAERQLVAKVRELGTKLEDARRKQTEAQAAMRGEEAAPKVDAPTSDVIEQQRRINRARDAAGNETARLQRQFNEGKRTVESATNELKKIEQKVDSVARGDSLTWDEDPPSSPRAAKK